MRPAFLELLAPRCHRCGGRWRAEPTAPGSAPAWLRCENGGCPARTPVIDGIPVLTPDATATLAANAAAWLRRDDLPADFDALLNASTGPNSWSDAPRQQLSTYAWDHYGDLDPDGGEAEPFPAGSAVQLLDEALGLLDQPPQGPVLDAGCATGRTTLHLAARLASPALGIDLNAAFLRLAQRVLSSGRIRYDLRRNGLTYDRRDHEVILPGMDETDFWLADASQLPFADGTFGLVCALHVVDSCANPAALLRELGRVLRPGAPLLVSAPFDWSSAVTPCDHWLGGLPGRPDPDTALRAALGDAGLAIVAEHEGHPWSLRLHDRAGVSYRSRIVAAVKG